MKYRTIHTCRTCKGPLLDIISLGNQASIAFTEKPVSGEIVPMDLVLCTDCYLLQLKHTTDSSSLFNKNYGYRSGINETMKEELKNVVDGVQEHIKLDPDDVAVDIGCNDGTLLSNYPIDVFRVGFDPSLGTNLNSSNRLAEYCQENLSRWGAKYKIYCHFFNSEPYLMSFENRAKVVTAIAMFYDLDDPNKFLRDVYSILDDDGVFVIQQNYLVGMLRNCAFDNVVHEHLEYYSLTSLEPLLKRNGFKVFDVEKREINGGSFRTYIKKAISGKEESVRVEKMRQEEKDLRLDTKSPYIDFANKVANLSGELRHFIQKKVKEGKKVYIYGASTRGNSLLQAAKIDHTLISGAAERNPVKYGKFTAGTKILIVSEEEAREKADYFLVLPWFFKSEFLEREKEFLGKGKHLIFPLPKLEII